MFIISLEQCIENLRTRCARLRNENSLLFSFYFVVLLLYVSGWWRFNRGRSTCFGRIWLGKEHWAWHDGQLPWSCGPWQVDWEMCCWLEGEDREASNDWLCRGPISHNSWSEENSGPVGSYWGCWTWNKVGGSLLRDPLCIGTICTL